MPVSSSASGNRTTDPAKGFSQALPEPLEFSIIGDLNMPLRDSNWTRNIRNRLTGSPSACDDGGRCSSAGVRPFRYTGRRHPKHYASCRLRRRRQLSTIRRSASRNAAKITFATIHEMPKQIPASRRSSLSYFRLFDEDTSNDQMWLKSHLSDLPTLRGFGNSIAF